MTRTSLAVCLVFFLAATAKAQSPVTIVNPLGMDFPWELVHVDLPADQVKAATAVRMGDQLRPVQIQALGEGRSRAWFMATLRGERRQNNQRLPGDASLDVAFVPEAAPASPMKLTRAADHLVIENGVLSIRLATPKLDKPQPLSTLPPVISGIKGSADAKFLGTWRWEGDALVEAIDVTVLEQGPVFADVRVSYRFAGKPTGPATELDGVELADASLKLPDDRYQLETTVRVLMNDPWVQIREQYRLPNPATYWMQLDASDLKPDTVMWMPWFGYERFGGNSDLRFHAVKPQVQQRGPFVMMRPRWNQQPGGGMDFFLTRGGATPGKDSPNADYNADHPAVGVVASHPSQWLLPYAQTISAFAENGDTARLRFPTHVGARAYALLAGPRGLFDSTGKLNSFVRRRVDWTLDKQHNQYQLTWDRKPDLAGPRILLTRDRLKQIRDDYQANRDTVWTRVLKEYQAKGAELKGLDADVLKVLTGQPIKAPALPNVALFLERRYQDDFLNPTQRATRNLPRQFALSDLLSDGQPIGGPMQAAVGYVFTDLDHWPGLFNGWTPGNPNFHTDKYTPAAYVAAAMSDHPHAGKWMAFARAEFDRDIRDVLTAPDGVGAECPGYAGYSLEHQLEMASLFVNAGFGNPVTENPLFKKTGIWHRHLLTPRHVRLGHRHTAPIGDTHKWTSGPNNAFGQLGAFYKESDPAFASEMMGVWRMLREQYLKGDLITDLLHVDQSIEATPIDKMDWGSHAFEGFGSVMRSRFNTGKETFVSFKAGAVRGHYHNDDLSYHFYGAGEPVSLDYNCSYTPRGDHAALHNSMTFGEMRPFQHVGEDKDVPAMEQLMDSARVLAFKSTPAGDAVVAERSGSSLVLSPIDPNHAKFQYNYPLRKTDVPITHRRHLMLVKHEPGKSKLNDYLVVRDETRSAERQHLNIHLLAREIKQDGNLIRAKGQWNVDTTVYLASPGVNKVDVSRWYYYDTWMNGPGVYKKRGDKESEAAHEVWAKKIADTDGQALIPPEGWDKEWKVGEYQKWLRIETGPNTPMTWVLYPRQRNEAEPTFQTLEDGGVRVTLGEEVETVRLSRAAGATIERGGETVTVLPANP